MIERAKANGVNVYHYLSYLLEKLHDDRMSDEDLELLASWNKEVKVEIVPEYLRCICSWISGELSHK